MRKIIQYISEYISWANKKNFVLCTVFTALLVFINYYFGLNKSINRLSFPLTFLSWTGIFALTFSFCYLLEKSGKNSYFRQRGFAALFIFACLLFAWKMCFPVRIALDPDAVRNDYLNAVIYWPVKLIVVTACLYVTWKKTRSAEPFYGMGNKGYKLTPYLLMLLFMVPLVALASTRPDFMAAYPRYDNIDLLNQSHTAFETLLYELSYGSDFFTIELFFRGFLVLAFAKWAGKGAILPMAMFYCTIHFGKPLGECISSYFGGLLLGIITYHTRTIWGGLLVHVGIAWLMELAGHFAK